MTMLHPFAQIQKFAPGAAALGERQILVRVSDATPDRAGDVLDPAGCDHKNYDLNPIVLADHDPTRPIGNAKIDVKSDGVYALITFAPEGVSDKADELLRPLQGGRHLGRLSVERCGAAPRRRLPIHKVGAM